MSPVIKSYSYVCIPVVMSLLLPSKSPPFNVWFANVSFIFCLQYLHHIYTYAHSFFSSTVSVAFKEISCTPPLVGLIFSRVTSHNYFHHQRKIDSSYVIIDIVKKLLYEMDFPANRSVIMRTGHTSSPSDVLAHIFSDLLKVFTDFLRFKAFHISQDA